MPVKPKTTQQSVTRVPPRRAMQPVPIERPVARVPKGDPLSHVPAPHVARAPAQHPVSPPPHPRRPRLVREVPGVLQDLFDVFPDLPWPPRPHHRVRLQLQLRRPA